MRARFGCAILLLAWMGSAAAAGMAGDVDRDGRVTAADARIILERSVSRVLLGVEEEYAADVNGDGVIDVRDAVLALRLAEGETRPDWGGLRVSAALEGARVTVSLRFGGDTGRIEGPVEVRILNLEGQLIDSRVLGLTDSSEGPWGTAVFDLPGLGAMADLAEYVVEVSGSFSGESASKRLSLYAVTPRLSAILLAPDRWSPGRPVRVRVVAQEAPTEAPMAGVAVQLSMQGRSQPQESVLWQAGTTDSRGTYEAMMESPDDLRGEVVLTAVVASDREQRRLRKNVVVEEEFSTLLSTDKPIYQPGQTIHIRSLTLTRPERLPAAGRELTLVVADPKGNKVFKRVEAINEFGVVFADFGLASELNLGAYTISATVGGVSVERVVSVERYSLPKFKVALSTDRSYYAPGQTLEGSLSSSYFFGKPVAGGSVRIKASRFDVGFSPFSEVVGTTDAEGDFQFSLPLPSHFVGQPLNQGDAFVLLEAAVVDGAAHEEKATLSVPVAAQDLLIMVVPESGRLIPGVPNRFYLLATYPDKSPAQAVCRVQVGSEEMAVVETDSTGIGVVEFTPVGLSEVVLVVEAADVRGNQSRRTIALALDSAPESILVRTDRTLYAVGDEVKVEIYTSGGGGALFVDAIQGGRTLFSRMVEPREGRGAVVLPLSAEHAGSLVVSAYRITQGSDTLRDRRILYVDPANDLRLEYQPDQEVYRPGQPASMVMKVTDLQDRPVVAAVGLSVVDEAVFALQELQPGMEKVYFYLEEQLRTPRYEIHGFEPSDLLSQPTSGLEVGSRDRALGMLFATLANTSVGAVVSQADSGATDELAETRGRLANGVWVDLVRLLEALSGEWRTYETDLNPAHFEAVMDAAAVRGLGVETRRDPWGMPYQVRYEQQADRFSFSCAGPDQRWSTGDDLTMVVTTWMLQNSWWWSSPEWVWSNAPVAGIGGARSGLGGMAFLAPPGWPDAAVDWLAPNAGGGLPERGDAGAEPYLRQYVPEALYHNPMVITDADGTARVELNMADSITAWRMTGLASSREGRLGSATAQVRCFQDFFVDLDLPPALTRGDEVSVPVAVYNYLPGVQSIRLVAGAASWFSLLGEAEQTLELGRDEVTVAHFRIRVEEVGRHRLQVTAYGSVASDAVAREVEVLPDGEEILVTASGRLDGVLEKTVSIPADAIVGASKIFVKIYPGLFSQVVEGLEAMLQMPFGCFEQTSSFTYPNVLAVEYMKTTGQITPEILMKAEGFISTGYQRLLSYEVEGGGFEWFGNAPAHNVLTTYGLLEFTDMSEVWYVDPAVIQRTQEWLVADQEQDGSWIPTEGGIAEGAIDRYRNDVLRTTAYVLWGLTSSGYTGPAVERGVATMTALLEQTDVGLETYTLALCAHALLRDPADPRLDDLFEEFEARRLTEGEQVWWSGESPTMTYSSGKGADVELTALLAQAYMRAGRFPETVTKALNFLVASKDGTGHFGSTQATVLALKAFCLAAAGTTQSPRGTVGISLNQSTPVTLELNEVNADLLHLVDLQESTKPGDNSVRLSFEGDGGCLYQVVGRYYLPWGDAPPPVEELIGIEVSYDRTELEVSDLVTCRVRIVNHRPGVARMVVIDVGIPPGFEVLGGDLDALVGTTYEKYQIAGRQLIFYLDHLAGDSPVEFTYRLVARYPIRAKTPESTVYEYYTPDIRAVSAPQELIVLE